MPKVFILLCVCRLLEHDGMMACAAAAARATQLLAIKRWLWKVHFSQQQQHIVLVHTSVTHVQFGQVHTAHSLQTFCQQMIAWGSGCCWLVVLLHL